MIEPDKASSRAAASKRRIRTCPEHASTEGVSRKLWAVKFLAALAETSNVTAASAVAGIHPSRAYKLRRSDSDFGRAWRTALLEGYENLELEVLHRLRFGESKDVDVKFDNANALRLLGLHRETVAQERAMRENEELSSVRASLQNKLKQLREEIIARRAKASSTSPQDVLTI